MPILWSHFCWRYCQWKLFVVTYRPATICRLCSDINAGVIYPTCGTDILHLLYVFAKRQASLKKYETLKICAPVARHMSNTAETDVKVDGSLPDQLINPGDYESLLPTKAEHTAADYTENKKKNWSTMTREGWLLCTNMVLLTSQHNHQWHDFFPCKL